MSESLLYTRARSLQPSLVSTVARSVWAPLLGVTLAIVMQSVVRTQVDPYTANLLLVIGINIVLAVSLTMVNGFTGQFSMGHAGFLAVGGYASATFTYYTTLRMNGNTQSFGGALSGMIGPLQGSWLTGGDGLFLSSLLIGGLVAAALGFVVGLPSLRLRGDYLAIVTLGFGEIVRVSIQQTGSVVSSAEQAAQTPFWKHITQVGGSLGFSGVPTYTSLFWVYLAVAATVLVAFRLKFSTFGRAFLSIREDEIAAEAMGVNTTRYKVWAFVISAFFAGIAGGLFAHTLGVGLSPEAAGFMKSFDVIIMVVLGGLGSISGAVAAAIIVTLLPEIMRDPDTYFSSSWVLPVIGLIVAIAAFRLIPRARVISRVSSAWPYAIKVAAAIVVASAIGLAAIRGVGAVIVWASRLGFDLSKLVGDLSVYRMIIYSLALILIMLFRPKGLFGVYEIWNRAAWSFLPWLVRGTSRGSSSAKSGGAKG